MNRTLGIGHWGSDTGDRTLGIVHWGTFTGDLTTLRPLFPSWQASIVEVLRLSAIPTSYIDFSQKTFLPGDGSGGNFDKTGTYGSLESTQRRNAHCR